MKTDVANPGRGGRGGECGYSCGQTEKTTMTNSGPSDNNTSGNTDTSAARGADPRPLRAGLAR